MAPEPGFEEIYLEYANKAIHPTFRAFKPVLEGWKSPKFWERRRGTAQAIPEPIQRIRYRVKRPESIIDKFQRQPDDFNGSPAENLRRMRDVLGARIITYIPDHIRLVDREIRSSEELELSAEFKPRLYLPNDSAQRLGFDVNNDFEYKGPKDSGYASIHYFVRLREPVADENPWIELQVRTMLEEVWAEIEHQLGYKRQQQTEFSVSRQFRVISHHLRAADDHFDFLYDRLVYLQAQANPDAQSTLNAENFPKVLGEFEIVVQQGDVGSLISILNSYGIETVKQLRARLAPAVLVAIRNQFRILRPHEHLTAFHIIATIAILRTPAKGDSVRRALISQLALQEAVMKSRNELHGKD